MQNCVFRWLSRRITEKFDELARPSNGRADIQRIGSAALAPGFVALAVRDKERPFSHYEQPSEVVPRRSMGPSLDSGLNEKNLAPEILPFAQTPEAQPAPGAAVEDSVRQRRQFHCGALARASARPLRRTAYGRWKSRSACHAMAKAAYRETIEYLAGRAISFASGRDGPRTGFVSVPHRPSDSNGNGNGAPKFVTSARRAQQTGNAAKPSPSHFVVRTSEETGRSGTDVKTASRRFAPRQMNGPQYDAVQRPART